MKTLLEALRAVCTTSAERDALVAPGRLAMSFRRLVAQSDRVGRNLAAHGVGPGDRVAVVLGNGPEMAAAFVAVAGHATCAPLNPAYTEHELEFYFDDLAPKALLCDPALPSQAARIARRRGIPVLELRPDLGARSGEFFLGERERRPARQAAPSDVALVLHTSGTTSRPKMVALSHANLVASAGHIAKTLALTSEDLCFNIMPLFHIHGLMAGLLSSLLAGAGVVATSGFDPERFGKQLAEFRPTWITAVPTMYELIGRLPRGSEYVTGTQRLRLLRSSSASLPPTLMRALEDAFGVPVIEAYGMTEAAHQMASNPLPPRQRKAGSVGLAAGPEVAIMSPDSPALMSANQVGEIVIRGANVTSGYVANPEANAKAFSEGWFRTGDQGHLDDEGYLFITGRLKELINRGGEKISPREVDEALLAIPGVRQAVAFALPHVTLGEDVAAAVVLEPSAQLDVATIRQRLAEHLSPFKVPSRVLFLSEIPKGPTGKVQRVSLAKTLANELREEYVAPATPLEQALVTVWQEVLGRADLGVTSNFFALGGDSLRAVRISARAAELGYAVSTDAVFRAPTIKEVASHVTKLVDSRLPGESEPGTVRPFGFQLTILLDEDLANGDFPSPSEVVLESERPFDRGALLAAVCALVGQHEALRLRFVPREGRFMQELLAADAISVERCLHEQGELPFAEAVRATKFGFDLTQAPLLRVLVARPDAATGARHRLVIVAHHLVVDASSMQIVAEDFATAYEQHLRGEQIALPEVATPFVAFLRRYDQAAKAGRFSGDGARWTEGALRCLRRDDLRDRKHTIVVAGMRYLPLPLAEHGARLEAFGAARQMSLAEVLFAATAYGLRELARPNDHARLTLLSSGRDQPLLGSLARTVGCLATPVPVLLQLGDTRDFARVCELTRAALNDLPSGGFSATASLTREPPPVRMAVAKALMDAQALFNYKGSYGSRSAPALTATSLTARSCSYRPEQLMENLRPPQAKMGAPYGIQTHYEIADGQLFGDIYYSSELYSEEEILRFRSAALAAIDSIRSERNTP